MLFVLAWFLWLNHRNEDRTEDSRKDVGEDDQSFPIDNSRTSNKLAQVTQCLDDVARAALSDYSTECLFIQGTENEHSNGHLLQAAPAGSNVIPEDIITQSAATNEQSYNFDDFDDWDDEPVLYREADDSAGVKKAKLLTQSSIRRDKGEGFRMDGESDLLLDIDNTEGEIIKTATISSQASIKRPSVIVASVDEAFEQVDDDSSTGNETSSLNLLVGGGSRERVRKISESSIVMESPAITINVGLSPESDNRSEEDNEISNAFHAVTKNSIVKSRNVATTSEASGRIHSIVVNNSQPTQPTKIRCSSPRLKAVLVSPSTAHDNHIRLTVNNSALKTSSDNVEEESSKKNLLVKEDHIAEPYMESSVESGNPSLDFVSIEERNVGKLQKGKSEERDPQFLEKHSMETTDFDTIMQRRKKQVDTMDKAGRLLANIASRDEKVNGAQHVLSKHWLKVKHAVRNRQYLEFKNL